MGKGKTDSVLLGISIVGCLTIMAGLLLMPVASLHILPGVLVWTGLAINMGTQIALAVHYRAYRRHHGKTRKRLIGLLEFFSNGWAAAADVLLAVSLVSTVIVMIWKKGYGVLCFVLLAVTVFAFCMHCILNGKIYAMIREQKKLPRKQSRAKNNRREEKK